MDFNETRSSAPAGQLLSRRSVVRAGATAAWTVPLVQLVGAAPALAVSTGTTTTLEIPTITASYQTQGDEIRVSGTVKNPGTYGLPQVVLTFTAPTPASITAVAVNAGDFSGTANGLVGSVPAGATKTFDVTLSVTSSPGGNVTASVTSDNAEAGSNFSALPLVSQSAALEWAATITGAYLASDATKLDVTTSVKNLGAHKAKDVSVKVTLPVSATGVVVTVGTGWSASAGPGLAWTFTRAATLAVGATDGFTARFTVADTAGGPLKGEASASNVGTTVVSPAMISAAQTTLAVNAFSAVYSSTDASKLVVSATIKNTGGAATQALAYTLTVPAGLYNTVPTASTPSGWSAPAVTGTGNGPWALTYTASSQVAKTSGTLAFSSTISLADSGDAAKYAGDAFNLGNTATASNAGSVTASPSVVTAATPSVAAVRSTPLGTWSKSDKTTTVNAYVKNTGPRTVTKLQMTVTFSRVPSGLVVPTGWSIVAGGGTSSVTIQRTESLVPNQQTSQLPVFQFPPGDGNPEATVSSVTVSVG